jgi:uncharacterized protein
VLTNRISFDVPDPGRLVVVGEGNATGTPDQCVLHAALNVMADTAEEAIGRLAVLATEVLDSLQRNGVEKGDVRTTNLRVQDFFDQAQQRVTARFGSYQLEVVVRDRERLGEVVAVLSAVASESFQLQALQLRIGEPEPLRREARVRAMDDARNKAQQLADAAGVRLGRIISIQQGPDPGPLRQLGPTATAARMGPGALPPVPVEPGSLSIAERFTLTYEID